MDDMHNNYIIVQSVRKVNCVGYQPATVAGQTLHVYT